MINPPEYKPMGCQGYLFKAVLGCYLCVISCFYCQAQPILKRKIPSNNKPSENKPSENKLHQKEAHQKRFLNKYKPGAYYRNFTVYYNQPSKRVFEVTTW